MCNNPNLLPEVNRAKCTSIPLMIFAIINLLNVFNMLNPIFWGPQILVPLLGLVGGIVGLVASSLIVCCTQPAKDQQSKGASFGKFKCAFVCATVAAVCWGGVGLGNLVFTVQLAECANGGSGDCYDPYEEAGWGAKYDPWQLEECMHDECMHGEKKKGYEDCCAAPETQSCALGNIYLSEAACMGWIGTEGVYDGIERCAHRVCCSMANEPPPGLECALSSQRHSANPLVDFLGVGLLRSGM